MSVEKHINNNHQRRTNLQEFIRWGSHIGALIPIIVLAVDYFTDNLTANPIQTATQRTGDIALILLVLMLAVTPILIFYQTNLLKGMRKRLGLYAFFYTSVHLYIFFVLDYGLDWNQLIQLILQKLYLIFGLIAFIILLAMAITSFQWWKKKLAKNWKRLHRLVYLAAILIIFHYALAQKGDILSLRGNLILPITYGIVTVVLLLLRPLVVRKAARWLVEKIRLITTKRNLG
jgi:methionine sulfoxide reductase heme-binding subunit